MAAWMLGVEEKEWLEPELAHQKAFYFLSHPITTKTSREQVSE
jgi:hypothetical protein